MVAAAATAFFSFRKSDLYIVDCSRPASDIFYNNTITYCGKMKTGNFEKCFKNLKNSESYMTKCMDSTCGVSFHKVVVKREACSVLNELAKDCRKNGFPVEFEGCGECYIVKSAMKYAPLMNNDLLFISIISNLP